MARLHVESDADEAPPSVLSDGGGELLALISFGTATKFGAQHPLALLAGRLERHHGIDLAPLLTFYDRDVEDDFDARALEAAWQPAGPVAVVARAAGDAIEGDPAAQRLAEDHPALLAQLRELAAVADWATAHEARLRLSFDLE